MNNLIWPTRYVAWDLETTGLDPNGDRPVEFAALMVDDGKVVETYSAIMNHGIDIPESASRIHGITKERCAAEGKDPKEVMKKAIEIFAAYPSTITHNGIRFDIPFFLEEVYRHPTAELTLSKLERFERLMYSTCVDTAALFKGKALGMGRKWNEPFHTWALRVLELRAPGVKYNVGFCCDTLGIDRSKVVQHRAGGDVELTNEIYKKLIAEDCGLEPKECNCDKELDEIL